MVIFYSANRHTELVYLWMYINAIVKEDHALGDKESVKLAPYPPGPQELQSHIVCIMFPPNTASRGTKLRRQLNEVAILASPQEHRERMRMASGARFKQRALNWSES
eukprot:3076135-Amphidinium_carterae.1